MVNVSKLLFLFPKQIGNCWQQVWKYFRNVYNLNGAFARVSKWLVQAVTFAVSTQNRNFYRKCFENFSKCSEYVSINVSRVTVQCIQRALSVGKVNCQNGNIRETNN